MTPKQEQPEAQETPPAAGAENAELAKQVLGDVPQVPATPPTPEELAAQEQVRAQGPEPAVAPEAPNPSNVENAEINPAVAQEIATTDAEIQAGEAVEPNPEVPATPAAQAAAEEVGVDLTKVEGSGVDGKVLKSDVVEAAAEAPAEPTTPVLVEGQQVWQCLDEVGAVKRECAPFSSDVHLTGIQVVCPQCGGTKVTRQEGLNQPTL